MMLQPITTHEAALAFEACAGLDPESLETPRSAANAGRCFRLSTGTGQIVLSVGGRDGVLWCFAAAGTGQGMTGSGLDCLERLAIASGFDCVRFQTMRRGLVKRAKARGYEIRGEVGRGFILQKVLM